MRKQLVHREWSFFFPFGNAFWASNVMFVVHRHRRDAVVIRIGHLGLIFNKCPKMFGRYFTFQGRMG